MKAIQRVVWHAIKHFTAKPEQVEMLFLLKNNQFATDTINLTDYIYIYSRLKNKNGSQFYKMNNTIQ